MSVPAPATIDATDAEAAPIASTAAIPDTRAGDVPGTPGKFVPRPDPLYHTVILVMCAGVIGLACLLSVRGRTQVLVPVLGVPLPELCTFRRFTRLDCPGCGMTRCFISLAHGDLRAAWSYNPAGIFLFALFAFQIPYRGVQLWRIRRGLGEYRPAWWTQWALIFVAGLMVCQWALRQIGFTF